MRVLISAVAILILIAAITPSVQAFEAHSLILTVQDSGDTAVNAEYSLSWLEWVAAFLRIADPAEVLRNDLEDNLRRPIRMDYVNDTDAGFTISRFAVVIGDPTGTTYITPALSFTHSEEVLRTYWFGPLVSPDFSPDITEIRFPDGYHLTYHDRLEIPAAEHTVRTGSSRTPV